MTSVRIKIGLQEYQFEIDSPSHAGGGQLLRPRDAVRIVQQLGTDRELRRLRSLATRAGRRSFRWDDELRPLLTELVANGRIRVRKIDARIYRTVGTIPEEPELVPLQPVVNEILDTHGVMIELIDAEGNPVPGEPFRIKLPDGTVTSGALDEDGKAHIAGIPQAGTCQVCFYRRDAAVWAPA